MEENSQFKNHKRNNLILFSLSVFYIFILGVVEEWLETKFAYITLISAIYIASIYTVRKKGVKFFYAPAFLVILTWLAEILKLTYLSEITSILSTLFFIYVIVLIITKVAESNNVGILELLESINVYLLLGIAGSILYRAVYAYQPAAFNFPGGLPPHDYSFIYFSFVTQTTLGYGDIAPVSSMARSLAIFFSVAGQLYLTMIIAMLVGKYIGKTSKN
jgi:voltage-gated potassium channel